jgi:hypothetical protein
MCYPVIVDFFTFYLRDLRSYGERSLFCERKIGWQVVTSSLRLRMSSFYGCCKG